MVVTAVSLMANIYVVRLHEQRSTSRMSATMRYLVFRIIAPLLCYGNKAIVSMREAECGNSITDEEACSEANDRNSNVCNPGNSNIQSSPQKYLGTEIVTVGCFKEERRAAADILDRLFLVFFSILFIILAIYSFLFG